MSGITVRQSLALPKRGSPNQGLLKHARASSVLLQFRQMSFRPSAKRVQRIDQRASEASERVFDFRRDDRMNFAQDQAVALQAAECLREHLLRNLTDFPL